MVGRRTRREQHTTVPCSPKHPTLRCVVPHGRSLATKTSRDQSTMVVPAASRLLIRGAGPFGDEEVGPGMWDMHWLMRSAPNLEITSHSIR